MFVCFHLITFFFTYFHFQTKKRTKEIENIEIIADPQNALDMLNPKLLNDISNGNSSTLSNENETKTAISVSTNNSNNNNNKPNLNIESNNGNVSKNQPLKVNLPSNNNNKNSNVSPASVSPPNYANGNSQHYNNNEPSKRKTSYNNGYTNGYGNGHGYDNHYHSNNNNNENCFTSVNVETIKEDFDFEQNLAMFDKDAFYEEIEGHSKPAVAGSSNHDEPLNAYDSLIKQLNSNGNNGNHANGLPLNDSSKQQFTNQTNNQRYHQISVANLFSSTTAATINNSITNNITKVYLDLFCIF